MHRLRRLSRDAPSDTPQLHFVASRFVTRGGMSHDVVLTSCTDVAAIAGITLLNDVALLNATSCRSLVPPFLSAMPATDQRVLPMSMMRRP